MTRLKIYAGLAAAALLAAGCCEPLPCTRSTIPEPPSVTVPDLWAAGPLEIPVVAVPSKTSSTVSFSFVFATGSSEDPAGKKGLTMLTAELIANGGTENLTYSELLEKLFPMAAEIDVQVGADYTRFSGRAHKDHIDDFYALLRDVLLKPRLAEPDFNRIRQKMLSDLTLTLRGNDDEELGKAALAWKMYGDLPYGSPALGTESGLGAISLDDVKAHREKVMCGSRLVIGLAGAVPEGFADKLREEMKALPNGCEPRPELPAQPASNGRRVLLVDKGSADSTAISIGFPIQVRRGDPDYAAMKLVETYFGQHRVLTGALQRSIRVKRGFNYGNYAYVEHFEQGRGGPVPETNIARRQQYFSIWIRPVKDADKHFALRLAMWNLEKLIENGISESDFETTRTYMKRYYMTFAQTEQRRLGYAIDDFVYGEKPPYFDKLFSDLDKLSAADVNAAIRKYLTKDNLYIAMVTKNAKEFAEAIASDGPSPVVYASPKPDDVTAEDKLVQEMKLSIPRESIEIVDAEKIFE